MRTVFGPLLTLVGLLMIYFGAEKYLPQQYHFEAVKAVPRSPDQLYTKLSKLNQVAGHWPITMAIEREVLEGNQETNLSRQRSRVRLQGGLQSEGFEFFLIENDPQGSRVRWKLDLNVIGLWAQWVGFLQKNQIQNALEKNLEDWALSENQ